MANDDPQGSSVLEVPPATSPPTSDVEGSDPGEYGLPPSTDPRNLLTPIAVRRALSQLQTHSKSIDAALDSAVRLALSRIAESRESVIALAPQIDLLGEEAQVLRSRLIDAAKTSDRISGAVRALDEERRRIRQASIWVQHTQDLKGSLASLASAVDQGEWELATKHAQKAMAVPHEIIDSDFCKRVVPSTEQPLPPSQTLETLRRQLLHVFTQRFRQATEALDQAEASRYFRLFPQLGFRTEGLQAYSSFARSVIAEKGKAILEATTRAGTAAHPQLLTTLFEQLALLIDTHQPVVDRHYGEGNFIVGVMPGLQEECDRIGTRIIDSWLEKAAVMRRLEEARNFTFHFLANLGSASSSSGQGSSKGPAAKPSLTTSKFGLPGRASTPLSATRPGTPSIPDEPQPPDGRDVDRLLNELAAIAARWATYTKFLSGRLFTDPEDVAQSEGDPLADIDEDDAGLKDFRRSSVDSSIYDSVSKAELPASDGRDKTETSIAANKILNDSLLGRKVGELLEDIYCPLERWYLRSSLEKAHRIDAQDINARPMTSSVLDDAFFLIRATLTRILSTCHLTTISSALRSLRTTVDDDYIQVLVRRLESTWRNVGGALAGPDGPRKESAIREMRVQFILYLNVLSVSASYADRILSDLSSESQLAPLFASQQSIDEAREKVTSLAVLSSRLRSAAKTELEHLFIQVTRPRLRILLTEIFRDVSYNLASEADFSDAEYNDVVRRRFVKGWDAIVVAPYRDLLTELNFEAFYALCVESFVRPMEKWIMTSSTSTGVEGVAAQNLWRFTELGALRFDKDWRSIAAHLGSHTNSGEIRDKFARIQQIAYVLSLDDDNDEEIYESGAATGFSWRLSASEVRAVRALRT